MKTESKEYLELCKEYQEVLDMTESEVVLKFNAESKEDYINILLWEMNMMEASDAEEMEEYETSREIESERAWLCHSQGLAY